jgi:DNA-binding IclR family transcriptional regulator
MNKYSAPALEKGLDILEYLSQEGTPQSQSEIAQGINKTPNEIYRMLAVLEMRGFLIKSDTGRYSISLKLYHLSHRHSPIDGLLKISKSFMEDLSNKTKQSCHMGILYNGQLMIISQTQSPGPVSLSIEEGSLFPLLKTTSGRVILANMDKKQRQEALKKNELYIALNKTEQQQLHTHLDKINKSGYELKNSEITMGVTDIGVPIGRTESGIFSVLAISSLTSINKKNEAGESLIESLMDTAKLINDALKI